ncbi:hypothetical protein P43SY_011450 [Pythium insidiosum]|uniref:Protein odr-4 n=1 Tax=Pythium insidiosum TaxID=114742 RepID=A0AAD5LB55_PYTIN|nr:hypothetical protein P43SY_011450 [Pythium insidiosum]
MASRSKSRQLHVADAVHRSWESAVQERRAFEMGLVVGQSGVLSPNDLVFAAVHVPSESETDDVAGFDDLSSDWVQEVARQVDRLLPGGVELLGLYVLSPGDAKAVMDQAAAYVRVLAQAIALPPEFNFGGSSLDDVRCVVHICSRTGKRSARALLNLLDASRTSSTAVELRYPSEIPTRKVTTCVAVDETIAWTRLPSSASSLPSDEAAELVAQRLDEARHQVLPLAKRIWHARGVPSRLEKTADGDLQDMAMDLLTLGAAPVQDETRARALSASRLPGRLCGVLQCIAFTQTSAPESLAALYLKRDFVKTLLLRLELLLERASEDDTDLRELSALMGGGALSLPRRALLAWPSAASSRLELTLHVVSGELDAVLQTATELLGGHSDTATQLGSVVWLEGASESETRPGDSRGKTMTPPAAAGAVAAPKAPDQPPRESGAINSVLLFVLVPVLLLVIALLLQELLA